MPLFFDQSLAGLAELSMIFGYERFADHRSCACSYLSCPAQNKELSNRR
jgi:hypothetical protein